MLCGAVSIHAVSEPHSVEPPTNITTNSVPMTSIADSGGGMRAGGYSSRRTSGLNRKFSSIAAASGMRITCAK